MASASLHDGVVTLTLSTDEALYVAAELAGGNSTFHGLGGFGDESFDTNPYNVLTKRLRLTGERAGSLAPLYRKHHRVAAALRPEYDSEAGRKVAERSGLLQEVSV